MNTVNSIRRQMLRPLVRRRALLASSKGLDLALAELEERAIAASVLPELVAEQKADRDQSSKGRWKDPISARKLINFALALYLARRITLQEYVFMAAQAAEGVHDGRLTDDYYPEIVALSTRMRELEKAHGLKPDQYWEDSDAPAEWLMLSAKWNEAADRLLLKTLEELEGPIAAAILTRDRNEFFRLRERGRRAFFHKKELIPALTDTVKRYEIEATAAASAKAYTAAVTLLGAALEGLLTLRCVRSRKKAAEFAVALPAKKRPRSVGDPTTWSFDTLIEVCLSAGWLPAIKTPSLSVNPAGLAHLLRRMRNNIHPGRVSTESPWIEAERRDFDDAEQIYTTLYAAIFRGSLLRSVESRAQADAA